MLRRLNQMDVTKIIVIFQSKDKELDNNGNSK